MYIVKQIYKFHFELIENDLNELQRVKNTIYTIVV